MQTHELAVDEHMGLIVNGSEVEHHLLAVPCCRYVERALIPDGVDEVGVLYTRERALRAERYCNLAVERSGLAPALLCPGASEVEGVAPCAVEVYSL